MSLLGQPQTFDLFTADGNKATLNISDRGDHHNNYQSIFLIKENFLQSYLKKNGLTLIWAIWGEREYSYEQMKTWLRGQDRPDQPYAVYSYVKRYEWS